MKKIAIAAALALVLPGATTLLANGGQFFVPASGGHVELVYFGRVKDARTGRPLQKKPYVTFVDPFTGIFLPFDGDAPGHFRSPDVGAALLEVSGRPFATGQFEIMVSASGYKTTKVAYIPRQQKGTVELTVKMEPKDTAGGAPASVTNDTAANHATAGSAAPASSDSSSPTFFLLAACFGLAAISAVAQRVTRPSSTDR